jgi:preprotein translocase subunit SecE
MGSKQTWIMVFYIGVAAVFALFFNKASGAYGEKVLSGAFTYGHIIGLVLGVAVAAIAYTNKKANTFVSESFDQLVKVAWPTREETKSNTIVVVVFSFISAGILGVFDFVFSTLTSKTLF